MLLATISRLIAFVCLVLAVYNAFVLMYFEWGLGGGGLVVGVAALGMFVAGLLWLAADAPPKNPPHD